MPTRKVGPPSDVPACDRCGGEAAFKDADGLACCEYCPAVDYGTAWGRRSAYAELAIVILSACAATGMSQRRLRELVAAAAGSRAIELPLAPPDESEPEAMSEGPWLRGLKPITGRGEAIVAARRGGAR